MLNRGSLGVWQAWLGGESTRRGTGRVGMDERLDGHGRRRGILVSLFVLVNLREM